MPEKKRKPGRPCKGSVPRKQYPVWMEPGEYADQVAKAIEDGLPEGSGPTAVLRRRLGLKP
jgi:hypothetical protein